VETVEVLTTQEQMVPQIPVREVAVLTGNLVETEDRV
jgi:hypothetical protein